MENLKKLYAAQATPRLSEDKVKQCVDPRLKGEYPPKGVAKVTFSLFPVRYQLLCFLFFLWLLLEIQWLPPKLEIGLEMQFLN